MPDPVSPPTRFSRRVWLAALLLAAVLAAVPAILRLRHVAYATDVAGRSPAELAAPAPSNRPELIMPGNHDESLEWLDQTRLMFARGEARVRRVDYENAPFGHDVLAASPYRWWLGLLAGIDHLATGHPAARAVEMASLYADPVLLLLLILGASAFTARYLGAAAAAFLALGLACLYPLAGSFLPGLPDDRGLVLSLQLASLLPLLAGMRPGGGTAAVRWFAAAGVIGGLSLWVSVRDEAPLLAGVGLGALLAAAFRRRSRPASLPWRAWGGAGAATVLGAYLAEFFPDHMGAWEFRALHPLLGLAWLGGADLVARAAGMIEGKRPWRGWADAGLALLALAAFSSLPIVLRLTHSLGFLASELGDLRLSLLPGSAEAGSLWAWLLQNGVTGAAAATFLPLLFLGPALALLASSRVPTASRASLALLMGPVAVTLGFACQRIAWWNAVDVALLALGAGVAAAAATGPRPRIFGPGAAALAAVVFAAGLCQGWPIWTPSTLSEPEVAGLVERDLAYWLSQHVGPDGATVLAPPRATAALYYYAGLRGLGTFAPDDRDGLAVAVRIVSATTPEEAQELFARRGVTHLVIPSWDPYLDAYAQMGEGQVAGTFLERLHQWILPPWLRPVAYPIPAISGFEGQTVTVLEIVDEQDAATAASRLAEYFVDMGQPELAAAAGQALRRYPADLGAVLAQAEVAIAAGDPAATAAAVNLLLRRIAGGADQALPWDERVGLAIVLAQTQHVDLARARLAACLADIDAEKLRSLSTNSLYHLQVLLRALRLEIADAGFRVLALTLLPADLRMRLSK